MNIIRKLLSNHLRETADKIDSGECGLSESELEEATEAFMHIRLNKSLASDFLHMSTRNFDRLISDGKLPSGKKDLGSNQLYWYKDELVKNISEE